MSLLAMALHEEGVPAISFTGSQSGIVTSSDHTEARILEIRAHRIREELGRGKVVIIAGFTRSEPGGRNYDVWAVAAPTPPLSLYRGGPWALFPAIFLPMWTGFLAPIPG